MKYYEDGDLSREIESLRTSPAAQERRFLQMIECIQELHSREELHRDIKPQNFLRDGAGIVVSDLGLSTEIGSKTAFTTSSAFWGSQGYIPPEFLDGGFKRADAAGDIFMLGKTFYVLLTGRDPMYLTGDGIPPPIFHVISRCCSLSKSNRYQSLSDLKQSLVTAYDVVLNRAGGRAQQLLSIIKEKLELTRQYQAEEISELIEQLGLIDRADQAQMCIELPKGFYVILARDSSVGKVAAFLSIYENLVEGQDYSWGYAEIIANNMKELFKGGAVPIAEKAQALDLAIRAAIYKNRFAAMDTCMAMVKGVEDEALALHVAAVIIAHGDSFLATIETNSCRSNAIRNALRKIRHVEDSPI
jgi:hypothetical protein